ncbi:aldehyde dehydrogenase family protein [Bacillus massiliigorillae]|uniref:aldehyde dehydrogenase family protein n=1 Tax=Bacillus massiliigorillae TaxID=1243664 RepID=UPI0003A5F88B|nr:aldehyde dehydrogenase family protein [Bacillus massiliigorillae]
MTKTKEHWDVYSPSTGEHIYTMNETDVTEVDSFVAKSKQAFQTWSRMDFSKRLSYFANLRNVILQELDQTTDVIAKDAGKVQMDALVADIMPVLDFLKFLESSAEAILRRQKVKTPIVFIGKKSYVEYMPRGIVLVISPWNYPFQLSMIPILSALVSGNTVIAKPSEITPYVGKYMEELFERAGFPEGVVQFAHGGKELGGALVASKPDYIFFTGSVATGKIIAKQAAEHLIPVTLELGGKDPMIVCRDANIERAAKGAVWGAFTNSGQVCMSVERLYVDETIYEPFISAVKKEVAALTQGASKEHDVGSMTFHTQVQIVKNHVNDALVKGAVLETGKNPTDWDEDSMFLQPMVLSSITNDMKIVSEETFGPIMPIIPFKDEQEAIYLANKSEYGLNASVWSNDIQRANQIASQLVSGAVIINDVIISVANHHLPFGGAKQSGVGRYHGEQGLRMFCHEKAIMQDAGKKSNEIQWYPYNGKFDDFKNMIEAFYGNQRKWVRFLKSYLNLLKKSK